MPDESMKRENPPSSLNSPSHKVEQDESFGPRSPQPSHGDPNGDEQPRNSSAVEDSFTDEEDGHDDGRYGSAL